MFDFGFSEILLTSAIALVVLGPERLPKVARQVGNWMGRARAMARQLSDQLEREVSADDLLRETKPKPASTLPAYTKPERRIGPPAIEDLTAADVPESASSSQVQTAAQQTILPPAMQHTAHGEYEPPPLDTDHPTYLHPPAVNSTPPEAIDSRKPAHE